MVGAMGDAVGSVVPGNWLVVDIEGNNDAVDAVGVGDSVPTAGEAVGTSPLPREVGSKVLSGGKVGIGSIGNVGSNVGSIGIIGKFVLGIVGAGVLGTCGAMVGGSVAGSTVNIGGASVGDCTGEDGSIF